MPPDEPLAAVVLAELRGLRADVRALMGATLSTQQACAFLGITDHELKEMIRRGKIEPCEFTLGGETFFLVEDLRRAVGRARSDV